MMHVKKSSGVLRCCSTVSGHHHETCKRCKVTLEAPSSSLVIIVALHMKEDYVVSLQRLHYYFNELMKKTDFDF
jgi:hypothetical protein